MTKITADYRNDKIGIGEFFDLIKMILMAIMEGIVFNDDAAKDEQRDIEARIEQLEKILKNAEVVDEDEVDLERINVGCRVRVKDMTEKEECEYKIVGSTEADSLQGKISNESPVGKALIGAKKGDTVAVETAAGVFKYKVLEIQRSN